MLTKLKIPSGPKEQAWDQISRPVRYQAMGQVSTLGWMPIGREIQQQVWKQLEDTVWKNS